MNLRGRPRWLVPFAGRNRSGETTQNFLWGHDNVYIMDNHRAALWCWLQHLGPSQVVSVFHIDEHYDCLSSQLDKWLSVLPDVASMKIEDYLSHTYKTELGRQSPTVRWDNYLSLFLERYSHRVRKLFFATHGVGQEPRWKFASLTPDKLPRSVRSVMGNGREHRRIVNIDLDYFFSIKEGSGSSCSRTST